jgi:hypothetical protein
MTIKALHRDVTNAFDFLQQKGLLLYSATLRLDHTRISWHTSHQFDISAPYASVDQYIEWAMQSHYSAVLPDASLLQITYDVVAGVVASHRLAYVPCPVLVDSALLYEEAFIDVVEAHLGEGIPSIVLRSPIRFDYDPEAEQPGHPAAHLTLNGPDCRIGCIAPIHPYQFLDFVYRHFYPELHDLGRDWFHGGAQRRFDERVLTDEVRGQMHITWPR